MRMLPPKRFKWVYNVRLHSHTGEWQVLVLRYKGSTRRTLRSEVLQSDGTWAPFEGYDLLPATLRDTGERTVDFYGGRA